MKEDVTEIILNIKSLVVSSEHDEPITAYLRKQGAGQVTAADISAPAGVEMHNPELVIATLNDKAKFELELTIERGRGYVSATPEPQRVHRGRPDPGRLDLLAGAQGHLPRRGHSCR